MSLQKCPELTTINCPHRTEFCTESKMAKNCHYIKNMSASQKSAGASMATLQLSIRLAEQLDIDSDAINEAQNTLNRLNDDNRDEGWD